MVVATVLNIQLVESDQRQEEEKGRAFFFSDECSEKRFGAKQQVSYVCLCCLHLVCLCFLYSGS